MVYQCNVFGKNSNDSHTCTHCVRAPYSSTFESIMCHQHSDKYFCQFKGYLLEKIQNVRCASQCFHLVEFCSTIVCRILLFPSVPAVPVFVNSTSKLISTNASDGDSVTFQCITTAIPVASVVWFKNGVILSSEKGFIYLFYLFHLFIYLFIYINIVY